jgi:hypothetical protein
MTTWQVRCLMAPRMWIKVTGSVCGLITVDVNLAQTSSEIQLTSLPVSHNATAECCAMWMSISGTALCLLTRLPATADLIKEQTFVITYDSRGRTSSFPLISCGEEEPFRFPPNAFAGSCRFLDPYVVRSTLGPVLYCAPVSRILGAP